MRIVAALLLACSCFVGSALARPQYSAMFGQSCFLCHANPTGNGLREPYGSQFFGPQYLPVKPVSYETLNKINPKLSENVTIGADFRTIWLATNTQSDTLEAGLSDQFSTNTGTTAQMEGNLYLQIRPTEQVMLYLSQGVADASGRQEIYGMANLKGFKAWAKGGQFQENFGFRFADHTAFTRTGLWSGYTGAAFSTPNPPHYGVGLEVGTRIVGFDVSGSYTAAQSNIPMDRDQQKRWMLRAYGQRRLPFAEKWIISGGGSWFHAPGKAPDPELGFPGQAIRTTAWGGFGGISFEGIHNRMGTGNGASNFGWLATSLLFEYDRKDWTTSLVWTFRDQVSPFGITSAYATAQLEVMAYQGVWLQCAYDWLDNAETSGIAGQAERTTIGAATYVLPWVEVALKHSSTRPKRTRSPARLSPATKSRLKPSFTSSSNC
ncbi:MAG: hypothetical protein IPH10_04625 [bacterium]|nr:hypothetical protein [bacterium]